MDPRLYMLAGTFALLVIAVTVALISMLRTVRAGRRATQGGPPAPPPEWTDLPPATERTFDPSLDGLHVEVAHDSPSASLLTPLRTGVWRPPESPAPAHELHSVALNRRIAEHPAPRTEPVWASTVPVVAPSEPAPVPSAVAAPPSTPVPAAQVVHAPVAAPPSVPRVDATSTPQSAPVLPRPSLAATPTVAAPSAASATPTTATPAVDTAPVSEAEAFAQAATFPLLDPSVLPPGEAYTSEPPAATAPNARSATAPAEAPSVTLEPPAPIAVEQASGRPAAVTRDSAPDPLPEPSAPPAAPSLSTRPRTVVRSAGAGTPGRDTDAAPLAPLASPVTAKNGSPRELAPEFVLAAPVEMWFGEHRVGVKAGTRTYDQFRRYAETLFEDLKAADNR